MDLDLDLDELLERLFNEFGSLQSDTISVIYPKKEWGAIIFSDKRGQVFSLGDPEVDGWVLELAYMPALKAGKRYCTIESFDNEGNRLGGDIEKYPRKKLAGDIFSIIKKVLRPPSIDFIVALAKEDTNEDKIS